MRSRSYLGGLVAIGLALCVAGCGEKPAKEDVATIGTILPLTGPAASLGKELRQGQQAAVEYINSGKSPLGKMQLRLIVEDGKGSPTDSVAAYRKLRSQGVELMQTTTTPVCLALAPQAAKDKVLLFADAAHPALSDAGPTVFRHSNTAQQEAELIAEFVKQELKSGRVAVFAVQDDFGVAFLRSARRLFGPALVRAEEFSKTDQDLRGVAQRALAAKPDSMVLVGAGKNTGLFARRLREAGYAGPIVGNIALGFPDARAAAGQSYSGVYHTTFRFERKSPEFEGLAKTYALTHGSAPSDFALMGFDTVYLVAAGIAAGRADADSVAETLRSKEAVTILGTAMRRQGQDFLPALAVIRQGEER